MINIQLISCRDINLRVIPYKEMMDRLVDDVTPMMISMLDYSNFNDFKDEVSLEHVKSVILPQWCHPHSNTHILLACDGSKPVGVYVLQGETLVFVNKMFGKELILCSDSDPKYTKELIGYKLIKAGHALAKHLGWVWIDNLPTFGYRSDIVGKIYVRAGAEKVGEIYRTRLD